MTPELPKPPSSTPRRLQTLLLSAVVLLLAGILLTLIIYISRDDDAALETPETTSSKDTLENPPQHPDEVAMRFMTLTMEERQADKAEELTCDDYTGKTPHDLLNDLTDWENDNSVKANATVSLDSPPSSSPDEPFDVGVKVKSGAHFFRWDYEVSVKPNGDSWAVCEVQDRTLED